MNVLIIGGSSGLGLELARLLAVTDKVYITGRNNPREPGIKFVKLDLDDPESINKTLHDIMHLVGNIDTLIYAAGFFQEGRITDISDQQIESMLQVGITAAIMTTKSVLTEQGKLNEFIAITSTSQWTPRLLEPVYTAVKAALGAYANSLSLDERVGKTLVAAPAGMATNFWKDTDPKEHDTTKMLDPHWVAQQILLARNGDYHYKFIQVLRQPARVEVAEERKNRS